MAFITFQNVGFRYGEREGAGNSILHDLNLEIPRGTFYVLLGPSGCGKTTALNLLAGFEQPRSGAVLVEEKPVDQPGMDRVVIFQGDDSLYPWLTAVENVEFPLRMTGRGANERRKRAKTWLARVGLANHAAKFPHQLSGGMKQRIQIARALVCDAPILLMDEPFGALDAQTRTILQDELVEICAGTGATVLFITHDIAEAIILADRIGVMRAGPGSAIKDEFELELPRPRNRGSVEFAAIYDRIQRVLGEEVKKVVLREAEA